MCVIIKLKTILTLKKIKIIIKNTKVSITK